MTILELADVYAKAYFMGRGDDARKTLQAAIIRSETAAHEAEKNARLKALSAALYEAGKGGGADSIYQRLVALQYSKDEPCEPSSAGT